jgi:hypothetical protein
MASDLTGEAHELQLLNLKKYPFCLLDAIEACEVAVTFGKAPGGLGDDDKLCRGHRPVKVEYNLKTDGRFHTDDLKAQWSYNSRFLESWVKQWFWPDTEVTIFVDSYRVEILKDVG